MLLALVYTYAQENRGQRENFYFVEVDVKYVPYLMLFVTFLVGGELLPECMGLLAAHLYDFLTIYWPRYGGGPSLIRTPDLVRQWLGSPSGGHDVSRKGYGTAYRPIPRAAATSSGNIWGSRGQGKRLGD